MEWIKYHEAEKVFDLRTENSTYQDAGKRYDTLGSSVLWMPGRGFPDYRQDCMCGQRILRKSV